MSLLLDTNVVSELLRPSLNPEVERESESDIEAGRRRENSQVPTKSKGPILDRRKNVAAVVRNTTGNHLLTCRGWPSVRKLGLAVWCMRRKKSCGPTSVIHSLSWQL